MESFTFLPLMWSSQCGVQSPSSSLLLPGHKNSGESPHTQNIQPSQPARLFTHTENWSLRESNEQYSTVQHSTVQYTETICCLEMIQLKKAEKNRFKTEPNRGQYNM